MAKNTIQKILHNEAYSGVMYFRKLEYAMSTSALRRVNNGRNSSEDKLAKRKIRRRDPSKWKQVELTEDNTINPDEFEVDKDGRRLTIVSREIWRRAQEQFRKNQRQATRHEKRVYMLGGMIQCGRCGGALIGGSNVQRRAGGKIAEYGYYADQYNDDRPMAEREHPRISLKKELIEDLKWERIENLFRGDTLVAELRRYQAKSRELTQGLRERRDWLEKQLKNVEERRKRTANAYLRLLLSPADVERTAHLLDRERQDYEDELRDIDARLSVEELTDEKIVRLGDFTARVNKGLLRLHEPEHLAERREICRQLQLKVVVQTQGLPDGVKARLEVSAIIDLGRPIDVPERFRVQSTTQTRHVRHSV